MEADSPVINLKVLGKIVEKRILLLRGHRVMIDSDLADLYDVETKVLNRGCKAKYKKIPRWFYVSALKPGKHKLEAPIWRIKLERNSK